MIQHAPPYMGPGYPGQRDAHYFNWYMAQFEIFLTERVPLLAPSLIEYLRAESVVKDARK